MIIEVLDNDSEVLEFELDMATYISMDLDFKRILYHEVTNVEGVGRAFIEIIDKTDFENEFGCSISSSFE